MTQIIYAPIREMAPTRNNGEKAKSFDFDKKLIVSENNTMILYANKYPYIFGHLLVIPKRYVENLEDLNKDEDKDFMLMCKRGIKYLKNAFSPKGFNLGLNLGELSSGSIKHMHMHIVPRFEGDTGFMNLIHKTTIQSKTPEEMVQEVRRVNRIEN